MNKENVIYIWILFSHKKEWTLHNIVNQLYFNFLKKEWNPAICDNMGGPGGHYAKWNKSDRERQLLYGLTYMWNLKQNKTKQTTQLTDTENRLGIVGIAGGWGWEGEKVVKGTNFQLQD